MVVPDVHAHDVVEEQQQPQDVENEVPPAVGEAGQGVGHRELLLKQRQLFHRVEVGVLVLTRERGTAQGKVLACTPTKGTDLV